MSKYKKSLIIYSILIALLVVIFLIYTYHSLVLYERNLVDNYIGYYLKNEGYKNIQNDIFKVSELEINDKDIKDGVKKLYQSNNLKYIENKKLEKDNLYVYDVYNNNVLINRISLKSKKKYKIMGILNSDEWEIVNSENYFDNGLYSYEIAIPENYQLYINNKLVNDKYIIETKDVDNLSELTEFISISKKNIYNINNLIYEPEIKILDENNKEVNYILNDNKINIDKEFLKISTYEEAKKYLKNDFDIMELAENYSLFLTDDLGGERHGLYKLTPYMLKDTDVYKRALSWSIGPDILMVSEHTFKNPRFTNEKLENFIIYNDLAFSVEVHLEKNMIVSHKDKVDVMNDRLYFIYYDGSYKWVKSESIKR